MPASRTGVSLSAFLTLEPDWGALAEGYPGASGTVCGITLFLTSEPGSAGYGFLDAYVWEADPGTENPGAVLVLMPNLEIDGIGHWPVVTQHDVDLGDVQTPSPGIFVGFWPHPWDPQPNAIYTAVDVDGPNGMPRVKVPPDQGYPSGWQHPSVLGVEIASWGIGAYVLDSPVPTHTGTWGSVKALYRN